MIYNYRTQKQRKLEEETIIIPQKIQEREKQNTQKIVKFLLTKDTTIYSI